MTRICAAVDVFARDELGDFAAALSEFFGSAAGLSASVVRREVGLHLGLQRLDQHPPGAFPHDLVHPPGQVLADGVDHGGDGLMLGKGLASQASRRYVRRPRRRR